MSSSRRSSTTGGSDDGGNSINDSSIASDLATPVAIGGAKTIGLVGGVALLINNITGSGMVLFPSLYQQAGWFPVTAALLSVAFLSYLCSIMIIEAMAAMPGNHTFTKRVEYTTLAYYYLGKRGYYLTQIFFQFSLAFNNMSSIIQSVQVMDFAIVAIFGKDCAIPEFYPSFSFHCPPPVEHDITPFGNMYLISIGFILTAALCAPLGFWNLDDNIVIQKISCAAVIGMVLCWVGLFIGYWGLESDRIAAVGSSMTQVLGVTVFNFAIITSIPSWVNEKKEKVSILKTMGIALPLALGLFSVIGIFGGLAFVPWWNTDDNDATLLTKLRDSGSALAHVTFYLFPCVVNLTSIPVFAIMQRYNLLEAKVCSKNWANFLGVVLPWLICIPFYTGTGFQNIVNWGGIVFNSTVNFIIPPLIYIMMVKKQQAKLLTTTQRVGLEVLAPTLEAVIGTEVTSENLDQLTEGHVTSLAAKHAIAHHHASTYEIDDGGEGGEEGTYRPPGSTASTTLAPPPSHSSASHFLSPSSINSSHTHRTSRASSSAMLGTTHADRDSALKQSLLGSGDRDKYYIPSEIDIRTEEEEEKDQQLLGYDPVEAEREEAIQIEKALVTASSRRVSGAVPITISMQPMSSTHQHVDHSAPLSTSISEVDTSDPESLLEILIGWQAMPKWILPYRIQLAWAVAGLLLVIVLVVVGLNIQQCATGNC